MQFLEKRWCWRNEGLFYQFSLRDLYSFSTFLLSFNILISENLFVFHFSKIMDYPSSLLFYYCGLFSICRCVCFLFISFPDAWPFSSVSFYDVLLFSQKEDIYLFFCWDFSPSSLSLWRKSFFGVSPPLVEYIPLFIIFANIYNYI